MMEFFRINTIIGLVITILFYALVLIVAVPVLIADCREKHISIWDAFNKIIIREVYEWNDKPPIIIVLMMICAMLEGIFAWEVHYPFVIWLAFRKTDEEIKNKIDETD